MLKQNGGELVSGKPDFEEQTGGARKVMDERKRATRIGADSTLLLKSLEEPGPRRSGNFYNRRAGY